jgi:chromosome partitioning protein
MDATLLGWHNAKDEETLGVAMTPQEQRAHVIVLGNEKGGSGKSTAAMHVIVGLLRDGYSVGAMDLDARQATLSNYLTSRVLSVHRVEDDSRQVAEAAERAAFEAAITDLSRDCDVVVIDCPGSDTFLSRLGHSYADTLITPINDSFVDFAMLAKVDPDKLDVVHPSVYSEMVWTARKSRFSRDRGKFDWIVMRNRLGASVARNRRDVGTTLEALAKRIGFRTVQGFGERVIFRELYLQGLTLMDLRDASLGISLSMSHVAARSEVRALLSAIRLPAPRFMLTAPEG